MGDFTAETESIRAAAAWMHDNVIATATELQSTMQYLNTFAAQSDWSNVPSCMAFGASYNSAIEVYTSVAQDLLDDAGKMHAALIKIATDYENADESSRDSFDKAIAAFSAAGYLRQSAADGSYADHRGDLHSDNAQEAPSSDADTGGPGSNSSATPAPVGTSSRQKSAS